MGKDYLTFTKAGTKNIAMWEFGLTSNTCPDLTAKFARATAALKQVPVAQRTHALCSIGGFGSRSGVTIY
jgi:hypothetical protein